MDIIVEKKSEHRMDSESRYFSLLKTSPSRPSDHRNLPSKTTDLRNAIVGNAGTDTAVNPQKSARLKASQSVDKNKISTVKLDPLSIEKIPPKERSPANKLPPTKKHTENSLRGGPNLAMPSPFNKRPNTEDQTAQILQKNLPAKLNHKNNLKPLPKKNFVQTLQPTYQTIIEDLKSPNKESKLKQKFKTAKLTEQELGRNIWDHRVKPHRLTQNPPLEPVEKNPGIVKKNSGLFNDLNQAKKFESPVCHEQKIRTLCKLKNIETDKLDQDEIKEEMVPESSFINLTSSRLMKKTHSTHLSLSTSDSRDSDFLGGKSYSLEGHLARSSDDKSLKSKRQSTLTQIREKDKHEERETLEVENDNKDENNSIRQPPLLFGKKITMVPQTHRPVFFRGLIPKDKASFIPVRPEDKENQEKAHLEETKEIPGQSAVIEEMNKENFNYENKEEKRKTDSRGEEKGTRSGRNSSGRKESFHNEIRGNILKWKIGEYIGAGNFGTVHKALDIDSGKTIAVKSIPLKAGVELQFLEELQGEFKFLQQLNHKNIVKYLGHETIDNTLHIYLEHMSGGNITKIMEKNGPIPEKIIKKYSKQLLEGLHYLHEKNVIHKDLKGANLLVDADGTVKLADFGCSTEIEKTLTKVKDIASNPLKGSIPWMAPEVVTEVGYGRRSDIWSFGCTILEMATGKIPWSHVKVNTPIDLLMKIALQDEIPLIPDNLSPELKDFLKYCLQRDPEVRPHSKDLMDHPFLKDQP